MLDGGVTGGGVGNGVGKDHRNHPLGTIFEITGQKLGRTGDTAKTAAEHNADTFGIDLFQVDAGILEGQTDRRHRKLTATIHLAGPHGRHEIGGLESVVLSPAVAVRTKYLKRYGCQCIPAGTNELVNGIHTATRGGQGSGPGNNDICDGMFHSDSTSEVILPPKAKELDMATVHSLGWLPAWQYSRSHSGSY